MEQHEEEVLASAKDFFAQKQYLRLRNLIWSNSGVCETDSVKVELLHLWEDSLYAEASEKHENKGPLSASTRYKLRKKNPCPIDMDPALMKAKNARLPKPVHDGLGAWLRSHQDNPYPNKEEKDHLASTLGITPQQVNRWFIQRRKILRLRGDFFPPNSTGAKYEEENNKLLNEDRNNSPAFVTPSIRETSTVSFPAGGRISHESSETPRFIYIPPRHNDDEEDERLESNQTPPPLTIADTTEEEEEEEEEDRKPNNSSSSSLLERILTHNDNNQTTNSSRLHQNIYHGGAVTQMMMMESSHTPLTPPQSISGESARYSLTPNSDIMSSTTEAPLDLSVKHSGKNVILEPVTTTPTIWNDSSSLSPLSSPSTFNNHHQTNDIKVIKNEFEEIDQDVHIAVSALLSLSQSASSPRG